METPPKFIKDFSKEQSQDERDKTAAEIRAKRTEYFSGKKEKQEEQRSSQEGLSERQAELNEQLAALEQLEARIGELSASGVQKIMNYFELRRARADIERGRKTYEELKAELASAALSGQEISATLESKDAFPQMAEAKAMVSRFYADQEKKWAESDYSKEDVEKNFTEEHLASLSLDDYALLMRRFPGEMVTHVTRQGVRDHTGHMWHTAGEGSYNEGFMKIAADGRLRSALSLKMIGREKNEAIASYLHLGEWSTEEEAMEWLHKKTNPKGLDDQSSYVDSAAIHFAAEQVADIFYGSEKGNEIFVAYPSAHIASQYHFMGQITESGGGWRNDQWIMANEERGMDIDAGIVFIPKEAKVGRHTGSRYELDENKKPIVNQDFLNGFHSLVNSPDFESFAGEIMEVTGKAVGNNLGDPEKIALLRARLESEFGLKDKRLQEAALHYPTLSVLRRIKGSLTEAAEKPESQALLEKEISTALEEALKKGGIFYKEASETVDSEDYWEEYFKGHSDQRPSKIVYYKGTDPTDALHEWKKSKGIRKESKAGNEKHLGFAENQFSENLAPYQEKTSRFRSIAEEVIREYYAGKPKAKETGKPTGPQEMAEATL